MICPVDSIYHWKQFLPSYDFRFGKQTTKGLHSWIVTDWVNNLNVVPNRIWWKEYVLCNIASNLMMMKSIFLLCFNRCFWIARSFYLGHFSCKSRFQCIDIESFELSLLFTSHLRYSRSFSLLTSNVPSRHRPKFEEWCEQFFETQVTLWKVLFFSCKHLIGLSCFCIGQWYIFPPFIGYGTWTLSKRIYCSHVLTLYRHIYQFRIFWWLYRL